MVTIDTVYQRVLAIANKEQRGYVTPLEFNLLANQAQMSIFEDYFTQITQANDIPGNETEYSDVTNSLNEKITPFEKVDILPKVGAFLQYPGDLHKLGVVWFIPAGAGGQWGSEDKNIELQEINYNELVDIMGSPLTSPTESHPVFIRRSEGLKVYPTGSWYNKKIHVSYIRRPRKVEWGYVVTNEQALYNASASTNFELHPSEETVLVMKILELAGVVIQKPDLVGIGQQKQ